MVEKKKPSPKISRCTVTKTKGSHQDANFFVRGGGGFCRLPMPPSETNSKFLNWKKNIPMHF